MSLALPTIAALPMTPALAIAALCVGAYLLGSVPFALILGKLKAVDIRKLGSGNVGATNLGRALGRPWGIAAFFLDFAKGLLPVIVAVALGERVAPAGWAPGGWSPVLVGASAIAGHVFPVYLGLRGGKGVATTFGVMAGLSPLATLAMALVWLVTFLATRTVSVASLAGAAVLPLAAWLVEGTFVGSVGSGASEATVGSEASGRAPRPAVPIFALAVGALIVVRHRSNIRRILRGEELARGGTATREAKNHAHP